MIGWLAKMFRRIKRSHKPFFKVVEIDSLKICVTDNPTQYRPFPEKGVKYLGFTLLDSNVIYVRGYRQMDGKIVPDYKILGHELSCLMRNKDPEIETLFYEKNLN